jgi:glutathione synthase/RimK-type ligase-like ATP-grasp enzyme
MKSIANTARSIFDESKSTLQTVRRKGRLAANDTGKSLASQLLEIIALRCGPGHLDADEYYQYRLYDDVRFTWRQKKAFFGKLMEQRLVPLLHATGWVGLANDKLAMYAFFHGVGLPAPHTYAAFHPVRQLASMPVLKTRQAVADYVRHQLPMPCIAKPVYGMWGRDVKAFRAFDADRDRLILQNGTELELDKFLDGFTFKKRDGLLFQELLRPHPAIAELCGPRICSVRMVTVIDGSGPRLLSTLWKVATGGSMADNYWEPGNMVAAIDSASGQVGRPFTGLGRDRRDVDIHPDTGRTLTGVVLPDWSEAVALCLLATASLPRLPMQAWDVALTDRGPVLLEVNVNGGMRLPQLVVDSGLYQGEFKEFLKNHGYPRKWTLAGLLAD